MTAVVDIEIEVTTTRKGRGGWGIHNVIGNVNYMHARLSPSHCSWSRTTATDWPGWQRGQAQNEEAAVQGKTTKSC